MSSASLINPCELSSSKSWIRGWSGKATGVTFDIAAAIQAEAAGLEICTGIVLFFLMLVIVFSFYTSYHATDRATSTLDFDNMMAPNSTNSVYNGGGFHTLALMGFINGLAFFIISINPTTHMTIKLFPVQLSESREPSHHLEDKELVIPSSKTTSSG